MRKIATPVAILLTILSVSSVNAQVLDPIFEPTSYFSVGVNPWDILAHDLNGDGTEDLVVTYRTWDGLISIHHGNGDGTFDPPIYNTAGRYATSVCTGDFNGDGYFDLAVTRQQYNDLIIFLNDGDGTFTTGGSYATGSYPASICCADFDGDSHLDLAVGNAFTDNMSVLTGNGDGSFDPQVTYTAGDYPYSICSEDIDGDGDFDIAVANYYSPYVSVYLNSGGGIFLSAVNYGGFTGAAEVIFEDIDADGDPDMLVACTYSWGAAVLLNNGDGSFAPATLYPTSEGTHSLCCGDLDLDGDKDIAVTSFMTDDISILLNNGDGTFPVYEEPKQGDPPAYPPTYPAGDEPRFICCYDIDGDRDNDLVVTCGSSYEVAILRNYAVPVATLLSSFSSIVREGTVEVDWSLSSAGEIMEFRVCRTQENGRYQELTGDVLYLSDLAYRYIDHTSEPGSAYRYRIDVIDKDGDRTLLETDFISVPAVALSLRQNVPNPFNPSTTIGYYLPRDTHVTLVVFDAAGRKIRTLVDGQGMKGHHEAVWIGHNDSGMPVSSGIYLYRLIAGKKIISKKMVLLR